MAGRTFEFSIEELELAGAAVDMLANGFAGWCHWHSAVNFLSSYESSSSLALQSTWICEVV
jgi:hypothetical protein